MELKWILAVGTEAAFWTLFVTFLLLRYRYGRDGASIVVLAAIVLDHVVLLGLAVWDFTETGAVSPFTVAILALLVYAFTLGRRDMPMISPSASTTQIVVSSSPSSTRVRVSSSVSPIHQRPTSGVAMSAEAKHARRSSMS